MLRKLSQTCEFQSITLEELLRDHLVFGIRDDKVREGLLRESNLTLAKTDEICCAAESMEAQMRVVGSGDTTNTTVSAVTQQGDKFETNKRLLFGDISFTNGQSTTILQQSAGQVQVVDCTACR